MSFPRANINFEEHSKRDSGRELEIGPKGRQHSGFRMDTSVWILGVMEVSRRAGQVKAVRRKRLTENDQGVIITRHNIDKQ